MFRITGSIRALAVTGALGLLGSGCLSGESRNPNFPKDAKAPPPTVVASTVLCGRVGGAAVAESASTFDILLRNRVSVPAVPISSEGHKGICSGVDWKPSVVLRASLRQALESQGARSILVPMIRGDETCANDSATVTTSSGATLKVESDTVRCRPANSARLYLHLFDQHGTLLWKASTMTFADAPERNEPSIRELLAKVPADLTGGSPAPVSGLTSEPAASRP